MNCQGSGEDKFGIGTGADPITSFSSKGLANNRRRYAYLASDPRANGRSPCKECGDLSDGSGFSMSSGSDYKARGVRERRELGPRKQAAGGRTIRRVAARGKSESTKASPLATSKYKGEEDREFGA